MSLLMISHDLNLVRSIAQRVCVMAGEIVEQRPAKRCSPNQHLQLRPAQCRTRRRSPAGRTGESAGVEDLRVQFAVGGGLFQRKTYLKAVDGISLNVQRGKTLGIVGESGSGKSTLGRLICACLIPRAVFVSGRVEMA
jgi:microcin C transport system ATP-binding protein